MTTFLEGENVKTTLAVIVLLLAQFLIVAFAADQVDVAATLVGTWEGEFPFGDRGQDRRRTLVVQSVEKTDGGFRVDARYGVTDRPLGRPQTTLQVVGDEVTLT